MKVAAQNGAAVYPKVRVADVLQIVGSGIADDVYRFALQAHFDFVVTKGVTPIFAVEFDGPSHGAKQQRTRDEKKDEICRHLGFPLLRITSRYLPAIYRSYDLLSWCIEQWFLSQAFTEAQGRGEAPAPFFNVSNAPGTRRPRELHHGAQEPHPRRRFDILSAEF
jgi:hypothetical protein